VNPCALPRPEHVHAGDPLATLAGADALMILTPWPQYRQVNAAEIAARMRGRIVIDPYRVLDRREAIATGLEYYTLGAPAERMGN
jgi:UDPglucose 6-dehydrogenase